MVEDLIINGKLYSGVKYITIRNTSGYDVKYYKEGTGGGGENINFRTATSEEIKNIFKQVVNENG